MTGCRRIKLKELEKLCAIASARDRALLRVGCATGLRISELLSLRRDEIETPSGISRRVWLPKDRMKGRKKGRAVFLDRASIRAIKAHLKHCKKSDFLFPGRKGAGAITRQQADRIIKDLAVKAGVNTTRLGSHSMRKTFAQNCYRAFDNDINLVKEIIGHDNLKSTYRYVEGFSESDLWKKLHCAKKKPLT